MPIPALFAVAIIILYLLNSINILKEYERGVIFRLGRVRENATGPGLLWVFRPLEPIVRVSLRQEAM
jgi:regulator of protease activity HflC (stomatin/prohibitin superfamily)